MPSLREAPLREVGEGRQRFGQDPRGGGFDGGAGGFGPVRSLIVGRGFVCRLLNGHKWERMQTRTEEAYKCRRCGKRHYGRVHEAGADEVFWWWRRGDRMTHGAEEWLTEIRRTVTRHRSRPKAFRLCSRSARFCSSSYCS